MTSKEVMHNAIAHRAGSVPQLVSLTGDACNKYGEALLKRYSSAKVTKLHEEGWLSTHDAIELSIGNHVFRINPPWWTWHDVGQDYQTDAAPADLPLTKGSGDYLRFSEACDRVSGELGCYVLAMIYGSHFEKAYFARGIENFLADMAGEPEYAQRLLTYIINKNAVMLENFIYNTQVDGVLLGSDWGSQRGMLMSPRIWRSMIKHGEQREYDLIKKSGKHVWIHSCGDVQEVLPDLCEMGVDVLNPVQPECMDIALLKSTYGDKLTFWGGISTQQTMPLGTPDEVRRETRAVIELMAAQGGYIASPAQDLQDDVPLENIIAMLDIMKEYS